MRRAHSTISVAPVWALEPNDLISMEFLGTTISGRIDAIPHSKMDLSETQTEYLKGEGVTIPDWPRTLGGSSNRLLLGHFVSPGVVYKHMFVDVNKNVAVFNKD